ncbi:MAG: twin-arginine translocation pathway signal protein [Flavobacterium psychrophilum]|nr:MAG: twin-arginine translocation pathway signal protein [Flavobacterium psychrophilum]
MKNGGNYNRRNFLKSIAGALLLVPAVQACRQKAISLIVKLTGTSHILGHRLWAKDFPKPSREIQTPYLIIGGGISGLSAARQLTKKGINDFLLLELENYTGGNSSSGQNKYSKYPLGAHYLPLPNFHDKELLAFLTEEKVITGYDNKGFPEFDEEQLTFTPQERLFYKNTWQEGLLPKYGLGSVANEEFDRFFAMMEEFRQARGNDGKYCFDIPVSGTTANPKHMMLDMMTMKEWLASADFKTSELLEYVDYCCRDDFGLGIDYVSAWAGIHYFAARKHNAGDKYKENVLTWPEGNARLATHLKKYSKDKTLANHIAYDVALENGKVTVKTFDASNNESVTIKANKVIMATPQFVNGYLLPDRKKLSQKFTYAPWLLATLTLTELPDDFSQPLSWDNVIFGGRGLGYIYDQHQSVKQLQDRVVITYYHSFSSADSKKTRKLVYKTSKEYWKDFVISDLKAAHPGIEAFVEQIDIHIVGHGMISPTPGFIFGEAKAMAAKSIDNTIYFAHSDLSGISIFEEAFHQGINAVNKMLHETTLDT